MFETKVVLIAMAKIVAKSKSVKEIYEALVDMANAEGVILKSYEEEKERNQEES